MKEGAGENPFADDTDDATSGTGANRSNGPTSTPASSTEQSDDDSASTKSGSNGTSDPDRSQRRMRIPYKFRRDGVQDGRSRVPLFLHAETKRAERDAQRELEDRFDDDVSLTDLREALVMAGLDHLDEVEAQLEEWGYGMTFEE